MQKARLNNSLGGFTLLEMLLTIAMVALLAGLSVPVYQSFQVKNDIDVAVNITAQTMRRAQALSRAMDGDTTWGIYVQSGTITMFQGASYGGRDATYDEDFDIASIIAPSGLTEVVYDKLTGDPQSTGTLTLTSTASQTRTITINEKGTISY
ncbi:Tfp pilus assembly protein FimT/FimU [Patescibacteria group bacterium]